MNERASQSSAPPIVALHGFAGHAESWRTVRGLLDKGGRRSHAITLFGHDPTAVPDVPVAFEVEVARVVSIIRALGEPVRLSGYSMGGRIALGALHVAPELVASAVLIGAHPGLTTDEERRARVESDEIWVRVLEDLGIEAFTERWQRQPLFSSQASLPTPVLAAQTAIRLRHDPHALALAMTSLGLAAMPSYWHVLEAGSVPIEIVAGALDTKFTALGRRMLERAPAGSAHLRPVEGAGHNVLLEKPEHLAQLLAAG